EHAFSPCACEECTNIASDTCPEVGVVRLEDDPLCAMLDGFLDVIEESPYIDIAPGRVAAESASTPDTKSTSGEGTKAVDADGVECVLFALGDLCGCL